MEQQPIIPLQSPETTSPQDQPVPVVADGSSKKQRLSGVVSTILILIAAPLVALFLTAFVFQSYEVDGQSMETTLSNRDRLIVLKVQRTIARITGNSYIPHRGDVIIFVRHDLAEYGDASSDKQLIKRVIGLPGDRVVVRDGKITVYNTAHPDGFNPDQNSPWEQAIITTPGDVDLVVPDGHVFACGDNRTNSLDSRVFGPVAADDIVGKLALRVFPFKQSHAF